MPSNAIKTLCIPCLDAFGLTLDADDKDAALTFLKNDDASVVVKARCNQDGAIQEYVLKATSASIHRQSAAVNAIESLLAENEQGVVVPLRRLTVGGEFSHIELSAAEATIWTVTAFEPNGPSFDWLQSRPSWTAAQTYSAGALLAKTHCVTRKIKTRLHEIDSEIETATPSLVPQLLLSAFESVEPTYLKQLGVENREHHKVVAILSKAARDIEDGIHAKALKDEEVIVHGDFQPGNVLYRDGKACGLIDWDYTHLDNPLMDLSYGLLMYAGNLSSEEAVAFDSNLSCKFLQGYTDEIADGGREPACMPDCYFTPSSRDDRVFSNYVKLSAALIMLWSLSECGQRHRSGVTVGRRTLQLIQSL